MKFIVLLFIALKFVIAISQANEVTIRKNMEIKIMKNTIRYLKVKLYRCLSDGKTLRSKRKVYTIDVEYYDIDEGILRNTCEYLKNCLIDCRLNTNYSNIISTKHDAFQEGYQPRHRDKYGKDNFSKHNLIDSSKGKIDHQSSKSDISQQNKKKLMHPDRVCNGPQTYEIQGKNISCEDSCVNKNLTELICRNLLVDKHLRLPNSDMCPRGYAPEKWRSLSSIQSLTFKVLDLKSFCLSIGWVSNMKGLIRDVKVIWDCDEQAKRLKWLNGDWAGEVDDNGFLHDIMCIFRKPNV